MEKEDFIPQLYKIVASTKRKMQESRIQTMKRQMNLKEYKNFLTNNIDEQADWPYILQQKLEEMGSELDTKIATVNQKKEELDEENRLRL